MDNTPGSIQSSKFLFLFQGFFLASLWVVKKKGTSDYQKKKNEGTFDLSVWRHCVHSTALCTCGVKNYMELTQWITREMIPPGWVPQM